ncbi:ABC transporter transmembrane domain-containing protein [Litoreibacter roseus]|uniref:Fe3+/spermidine/putrescine ABC transporter ATP-binding protein n=1 Tax=Litoreibacter roseus TaxID=2601869 RepID=A0A6N6JBW1_9RHOB|nr:ABC transporter transmembrane domain-containing protein [Litoreibacter roseus]GFE63781.1 Fe3+/spermidine/putrescine ABC transporter ATP-binding protein [Litoreibacter roseus]
MDAVLGTLMINMLALAVPIAMLQLFDRVIPNRTLATLDGLFLILLVAIGLDTVLKIARTRIALSRAMVAERALSEAAINRLFHSDYNALNGMGRQTVLERIMSVQSLRKLHMRQDGISRIDLLFSGVFILIIWALAKWLVLVPISMICGVAVLARLLRTRHRRAVEQREDNDQRRLAFLIEVLRQVRLVKLLGGEQQILRRYEGLHKSSASANKTLIRIGDVSHTTSAMLGQAATGLTSLFGAYLVMKDQIGLADLAACILLTSRCVQPIVQAFFTDGQLAHARKTSERMEDLLSLPSQAMDEDRPPRANLAARIRNLSVKAAPHKSSHLRLPALDIEKGALVVVDGDEMADAAWLLRLLNGESHGDLGTVEIPPRHLTSAKMAPGRILVSRRPCLFEGTLEANLLAFSGRDRLPAAMQIAQRLRLDEEIAALKDGVHCRFAGKGRGPGSTGLYKKIALIAAFAADPVLLLLEDPFADLDPQSQSQLLQLLKYRGRDTAIVIATSDPKVAEISDVYVSLKPGAEAVVVHDRHAKAIAEWERDKLEDAASSRQAEVG